jgi:hypothetical protein
VILHSDETIERVAAQGFCAALQAMLLFVVRHGGLEDPVDPAAPDNAGQRRVTPYAELKEPTGITARSSRNTICAIRAQTMPMPYDKPLGSVGTSR